MLEATQHFERELLRRARRAGTNGLELGKVDRQASNLGDQRQGSDNAPDHTGKSAPAPTQAGRTWSIRTRCDRDGCVLSLHSASGRDCSLASVVV